MGGKYLVLSLVINVAASGKWGLGVYAVFSSYRTPKFFQYYQLTVNENSNSYYFTTAFGMLRTMFSKSYNKFCRFHIFPAFTIFFGITGLFSCYRPPQIHHSK